MTVTTDPVINPDSDLQPPTPDISAAATVEAPPAEPAAPLHPEPAAYQRELSERIHARVRAGLDPKAHPALARILDTLTDLDASTNPQLACNLDVAVAALEREPPDVDLATRIVADCHNVLGIRRRRSRPRHAPGVLIVMGLCTLVYGLAPLAFVGFNLIKPVLAVDLILGVPLYFLLLIAFAGALGSGVSILVRIGEFSQLTRVDPYVLFLIGFFKPVIGMSFALFVFAVIQAGIIPVTLGEGVERDFFALALAFLAGFSERFAKDVVRRAEGVVGGQ